MNGGSSSPPMAPLNYANLSSLERKFNAEIFELRETLSAHRSAHVSGSDANTITHELTVAINQSEELITELQEVRAAYSSACRTGRQFTSDEIKAFRYFGLEPPSSGAALEAPQENRSGETYVLAPARGRSWSEPSGDKPETETDLSDVMWAQPGLEREPTPDELRDPSTGASTRLFSQDRQVSAARSTGPRSPSKGTQMMLVNTTDGSPISAPVSLPQEPISPPQPSSWNPPVVNPAASSRPTNTFHRADTRTTPLALSPPSQPRNDPPASGLSSTQWMEDEVDRRVAEARADVEAKAKMLVAERVQQLRAELDSDLEGVVTRRVEDAMVVQRAEAAKQIQAVERAEQEVAAAKTRGLEEETAVLQAELQASQARVGQLEGALERSEGAVADAQVAADSLQNRLNESAAALGDDLTARRQAVDRWSDLVARCIDGEHAELRTANRRLVSSMREQRDHHTAELEKMEVTVLQSLRRGGRDALADGRDPVIAAESALAAADAVLNGQNHTVPTYFLSDPSIDDVDRSFAESLNSLGLPIGIRCRRLGPHDYMLDQRISVRVVQGTVMVRPRAAAHRGTSAYEPLAKYVLDLYGPLLDDDIMRRVHGSVSGLLDASTPAITAGPRAGSVDAVTVDPTRASSEEQATAIRKLQHEQRALQEALAAQQQLLSEHQRAVVSGLSPSPQPKSTSRSPSRLVSAEGTSLSPSPSAPLAASQSPPALQATGGGGMQSPPRYVSPPRSQQHHADPQPTPQSAISVEEFNASLRSTQQRRLEQAGPVSPVTTPGRHREPRPVYARDSTSGGRSSVPLPSGPPPAMPRPMPEAEVPATQTNRGPSPAASSRQASLSPQNKVRLADMDPEALERLKRAALAKQVREMKKLQQSQQPFRGSRRL